jgi:hypothetical protein
MNDFMSRLASNIWPKGKRYGTRSIFHVCELFHLSRLTIVFCYSAQINEKSSKASCNAKEGNPFGPYWSNFDIDFDGDIFYQPLYFDIRTGDNWNAKYEQIDMNIDNIDFYLEIFIGKISCIGIQWSTRRLSRKAIYNQLYRTKKNKMN